VARRDTESRPDDDLSLDHALVTALDRVEQAVGLYLAELSQANLDCLREMLEQLDDQTAASDQWAQSIASAGIWGYADIHQAIGQTGITPVIDQEDPSLFKAQVAMVQAAKAVVRRPEPNTVETLREAFEVVMNDIG
jgi:hypothetical protein